MYCLIISKWETVVPYYAEQSRIMQRIVNLFTQFRSNRRRTQWTLLLSGIIQSCRLSLLTAAGANNLVTFCLRIPLQWNEQQLV